MSFYCDQCKEFYYDRNDVSIKEDDGYRIAWICNKCKELNEMTKRLVVCELCGNKWETQTPFDKTMCPACHKQTKIKEVTK